jgi:transposase
MEVEAAMCLKIHLPWAMPEDMRRIGESLLDEDDPCRLIGEQLFATLNEEEFGDLYLSEGKPGMSPVKLAFVSVFQFMEKLADRQAAQAVRMGLDWKYALHLPLDYKGFDFWQPWWMRIGNGVRKSSRRVGKKNMGNDL